MTDTGMGDELPERLRKLANADEYADSHYDKLHYPLLREAAIEIERLRALALPVPVAGEAPRWANRPACTYGEMEPQPSPALTALPDGAVAWQARQKRGDALGAWHDVPAQRANCNPDYEYRPLYTLPPSPHVEYSASRGQSQVTYWVTREEGDSIRNRALYALPPDEPARESGLTIEHRLQAVRATAIEECARVADHFAFITTQTTTAEKDEHARDRARLVAEAIRALEPARVTPSTVGGEVREALDLAVNIIMANEPGDSRAVSNEAVALAAVACGDTSEPIMKVIRTALSPTIASEKEPVQVHSGASATECDHLTTEKAGIAKALEDLLGSSLAVHQWLTNWSYPFEGETEWIGDRDLFKQALNEAARALAVHDAARVIANQENLLRSEPETSSPALPEKAVAWHYERKNIFNELWGEHVTFDRPEPSDRIRNLRALGYTGPDNSAVVKALEQCEGCISAAETEGLYEIMGSMRGTSDEADRLIDLIERRLLFVREYARAALAFSIG